MRVFAEIMRGAMNMPGSAGGGNSGSFSGGGGFSGGSGSGYSGGSHGGAMPHNTVNGTNNSGGKAPDGGRGRRRSFFIGPFLFIILFALFANGIPGRIVGFVENHLREPSSVAVEAEEYSLLENKTERTNRVRLPDGACRPSAKSVIDGDNMLSQKDISGITRSLTEIYRLTGVQAVLMLRREVSNTYNPSYGDINEFLFDTYNELFDDEGHVIILFVVDDGGNYTSWYICGLDTGNAFDETDAQDILDGVDANAEAGMEMGDCIRYALDRSVKNISEQLEGPNEPSSAENTVEASNEAEAPTESGVTRDNAETAEASEITEKETDGNFPNLIETEPDSSRDGSYYVTRTAMTVYFASLSGVVALAFLIFYLSRRHRERTKDENYQAHKETADHVHLSENPYYNNADSLPVRCPHCGALGALTKDGRCRYCGEKPK